MLERTIERRLFESTKKRGGIAYKFITTNRAGIPDRMVCLPGGKIAFIELKAPGKKPRPLQQVRHNELEALGQKVFVIDDINQVEEVLNAIQNA